MKDLLFNFVSVLLQNFSTGGVLLIYYLADFNVNHLACTLGVGLLVTFIVGVVNGA